MRLKQLCFRGSAGQHDELLRGLGHLVLKAGDLLGLGQRKEQADAVGGSFRVHFSLLVIAGAGRFAGDGDNREPQQFAAGVMAVAGIEDIPGKAVGIQIVEELIAISARLRGGHDRSGGVERNFQIVVDAVVGAEGEQFAANVLEELRFGGFRLGRRFFGVVRGSCAGCVLSRLAKSRGSATKQKNYRRKAEESHSVHGVISLGASPAC